MKIGVPKEITPGETRVALVPAHIALLMRSAGKGSPQHEVIVEAGAGVLARFSDDEYKKAGATIVGSAKELYASADIIVKVAPVLGASEAEMMREGCAVVGFLSPLTSQEAIRSFAKRRVTAFSMEYVPRISRAQSMDALSSMATVAGYKAVLLAADQIGKMFPLLMTAAGTVPPATVLILGAGVAGLQAIATAKRLGAKVEAFDPRPAVKEQVKSLGAAFIDMVIEENVETEGGYAKEQSEAFLEAERKVIGERFPKVNVVISTAQVFGKRAPILITEEMVKLLRAGSVIVDLAAEQGGNCALTERGKTVEKHGVTIIGTLNIPAAMPTDASLMYSKNVTNLVQQLYQKPDGSLDFQDEITAGACITHAGEIRHPMVRAALEQGESTR